MMDDLNDLNNTNENYDNDTMSTTIAKNFNNNIVRPDSSQVMIN
jgi:hypothetical protein